MQSELFSSILDEIVNLHDLSQKHVFPWSCFVASQSTPVMVVSFWSAFLENLPFWFTCFFYSGKNILVLFAISSLLRDRYLIQISFAFKEKYFMYSHRLGNTARTVWKILSVRVTMIQWKVCSVPVPAAIFQLIYQVFACVRFAGSVSGMQNPFLLFQEILTSLCILIIHVQIYL